MHCPKCGQQQVVDEMRFCSRCGFPLSVVTEVLSHGGTLPEREAEASAPKLTSRQRGKRLAVILLLTGILLAMIGGIIIEPENNKPIDRLGTLFLFGPAIICIVTGFARLLYALLLEGNAPHSSSPVLKGNIVESAHLDAAGPYHAALPASQGVPVADFGTKRVKTAEMANLPSVTENTTKLLDEQ